MLAWALICVRDVAATAQSVSNPSPGCRGANATVPEPWRRWANNPIVVTAAATPDAAANIRIGSKAAVTLAPAATVRLAVPMPDTNPPPDAHGGMLSFQVPQDGIYWISVSTGLWVDIVQGNEILMQIDERPGPPCSGINKSLQYRLKAGDARVQLSDNRGTRVDVLVVRQP